MAGGSRRPYGHMVGERYSRSPFAGLYLEGDKVIPDQCKDKGCPSPLKFLSQ